MALSIRRADGTPSVGPEERFGRLPESAIRDRDLSPDAKVLLAAIYLSITAERSGPLCLATTAELGRMIGRTERHTFRLLGELEARGHVERERVRTLPGSPRGIRPLARLLGRSVRQKSNLTDPSGCTMTDPSGHPDAAVRPPCQDRQGAMTKPSVLSLEMRERKSNSGERPASSASTSAGCPPTPAAEGETQDDPAELARLAAVKGPVGAMARARLRKIGCTPEAQEKAPGSSAKIPPGPKVQDSTRNEGNFTEKEGQPSRPENPIEHNPH